MGVVLGIDVSTTATKAILVDRRAPCAAIASSEYGFEQPHPLWSEQDPALWWDGAVTAIRAALAEAGVGGDDVEAVGLTGQMHGLVLLDAAGEVLRPAILWNDQRTAAECDAIRAALGPERLVEITGNDALTGFTAPKLVWVRGHEPDGLGPRRARAPAQGLPALPPDRRARDRQGRRRRHAPVRPRRARLVAGDARRAGHRPGLDAADVRGPGGDRRRVTAAAAARPGCAPGRRSWRAAATRRRNAVGVGAVVPGRSALSLGTSGVVFAATDAPLFEPAGRVHAFCHAVPGRWHLMSVMLSAAGSLRWFRDALAPGEAFGDLVAWPAEVPAGSDGLLFLPYLSGERSPYPDPLARGAFVGPDAGPRPPPPDARRARGRRVRPARRPRPHDRRRDAGPRADPRLGRRHREPGVAPGPGRRPGGRDRHGQHHRGRGVRGGAPGGRRGRLVRDGRATPMP